MSTAKKSISSFQALMVSTASRVGTGKHCGRCCNCLGRSWCCFLDVAYGYSWCCLCLYQSTLAKFGKCAAKKVNSRRSAYYIEGSWSSLVRHSIRGSSDPLLCLRLQRPAGLQCSALEATMFPTTMKTAAMITGLLLFLMTATVIFGGQKRINVITFLLLFLLWRLRILNCLVDHY